MASQDARLSKFKADFKQQQGEMINKIDIVLKAITDRIAGALPSDTVKNPKLSTYLVLSARSYPTEDPQCSTQTHGSINAITIHTEQQSAFHNDREKENKEEEGNLENIHVNPPTPPDPSVTFITEKVLKFNSFFESLELVPPSSNTELVCTKEEDGHVMFIEIVPKDDHYRKEEPDAGEQKVEYFDTLPTRSELAYHKYLMYGGWPNPDEYFYSSGIPSSGRDAHQTSRFHATLGIFDEEEAWKFLGSVHWTNLDDDLTINAFRKAHLFEDSESKVPSEWYLDELCQAFGRQFGEITRDFGLMEKKRDKNMDLHQHLSRLCSQQLEMASQITRDAVTIHTKTASQDIKTALEYTTQPII
ncbi:hypothetical protein Tco_0003093 [Tanacetum coccineum]